MKTISLTSLYSALQLGVRGPYDTLIVVDHITAIEEHPDGIVMIVTPGHTYPLNCGSTVSADDVASMIRLMTQHN